MSLARPLFKSPPRPWRILLPVIFLGVATLAALLVSAHMGVRIIEKDVPLHDASMMIKSELNLFDLALENHIYVEKRSDTRAVWEHMDKAEWYTQAMLKGGTGPEGEYYPMLDPALRHQVTDLSEQMKELRTLAERRLSHDKTAAQDRDAGRRFDAILAQALSLTDVLETARRTKIKSRVDDYETVVGALLAACALFTFTVGAVLYRYGRRRAEYIAALTESQGRLQKSERELAALLDDARYSEAKFRNLVERSLVGVYIL